MLVSIALIFVSCDSVDSSIRRRAKMASINYWAQGQAGSSRSPSPHITRSGGRRSDLSNLVIGSVSRSGSGESSFDVVHIPTRAILAEK